MPARRLRRRHLWYPVAALLSAASARGQSARAVRYRAMIDQADPRSINLTTRTGQPLTMAIASDTVILAVVPFRFEDIRPGAYVGTAAMPQPDGTQRALEVHVFPESMRGVCEGHRPYDLAPRGTITTGTVAVVSNGAGRSLSVRYPDGEKTIVIRPDTPIVTFEPGTPALLLPGAHCIVSGTEESGGMLSATRILVGKDGLVPPM